jgi:hypothetical protein
MKMTYSEKVYAFDDFSIDSFKWECTIAYSSVKSSGNYSGVAWPMKNRFYSKSKIEINTIHWKYYSSYNLQYIATMKFEKKSKIPIICINKGKICCPKV